ncbi:hypothetical protein LINGRAHAP2_LOCUS18004 [Linum grandiflorum]
MRLKNA